jgi:hypothetical protein
VSDDFEYVTAHIYNGEKFDLCLPFGNFDTYGLSVIYADGRAEKHWLPRNTHPSFEQQQRYEPCPNAVIAGDSIAREIMLRAAFRRVDRRPFVICSSFTWLFGSVSSAKFKSTACSGVQPLANGKLKITPRPTRHVRDWF